MDIFLAEPSCSHFPVVDKRGLSTHFRTSDQCLWSEANGTVPASVSLTSGNVVHIDVAFSMESPWIQLLIKLRGECILANGTLILIEGDPSMVATEYPNDGRVIYRLSLKLPIPEARANISPWGLSKCINWEVTFPLNKDSYATKTP